MSFTTASISIPADCPKRGDTASKYGSHAFKSSNVKWSAPLGGTPYPLETWRKNRRINTYAIHNLGRTGGVMKPVERAPPLAYVINCTA